MATEEEIQDREDLEDGGAQSPEDNSGEDERLSASDEDGGDASDGATDEEREAIRARRREERHRKKEAQREREESLRRELAARDAIINDMRGRLDAVERRTHSADLGQVDIALKQTSDAYDYYKNQIEVAVRNGNGAAVAEATEKMFEAREKARQLAALKQAATKGNAAPPPLDPRMINHAREWQARNKWYNPNAAATDTDTRIALQIDDALANEGWVPTTKEYWDELDARLKKYLPHRYNSVHNPGKGQRNPVSGSGKDSGSGTAGAGKGGNSYTLSADRVAALKEAGLWNDPAKREKAIARFREFDKKEKQA